MVRRDTEGFTFIEVLIALTLFLVITGGAFTLVVATSKKYRSTSSQRDMHVAARVAVDELARTLQNVGFGIDRPDPWNPGVWQHDLVYAGSHAIAFNVDLDPALGPIDPSQTVTFPTGESYSGEGASATTTGAETYLYTLDANGDDQIDLADRTGKQSGNYNPAAFTENPDDFALFLRTYGYDGTAYVAQATPIGAGLFTNAVASIDYPDGTVPDPLFTYMMREDLDRDGVLADGECVNDVVDTCPPVTAREPMTYLWGDDDFDGNLSDAEKDLLISRPVASVTWLKNPFVSAGSYASTTLASAVDPSAGDPHVLEVTNASQFAPGALIRLGTGINAEVFSVDAVSTSSTPHVVVLAVDPVNSHAMGAAVRILPRTLLRAVSAVEVHVTTMTQRPDQDGNVARPGQVWRRTSHGSDYRTVALERTVSLVNLRTTGAN